MTGSMIGELFDLFGQRAHAHLDTAAIATMRSAPTEIVPAPGPGKLLIVTGGVVQYVPRTAAMWADAQNTRVYYAPGTDGQTGFSASSPITILDDRPDPGDDACIQSLATTADDGSQPNLVVDCENKPLVVSSNVDPTGGDGDLYVTVFYTVVDLHEVA